MRRKITQYHLYNFKEIDYNKASVKELDQMIKKTKNEMQKMAKSLHFIEAGKLRDKLFKLEEIKRQKKTD